jgi:hypothetical protein
MVTPRKALADCAGFIVMHFGENPTDEVAKAVLEQALTVLTSGVGTCGIPQHGQLHAAKSTCRNWVRNDTMSDYLEKASGK